MKRPKLYAVVTGSVAAIAMAAVPGFAVDDTASTDATITVASTGDLQINSPTTTANLGSSNFSDDVTATTWDDSATLLTDLQADLQTQADVTGNLGQVEVVDARLGLVVSWTSTVSWTDFTLESTSTAANEVIAADQLRYNSGAAASEGIGTFTPVLAAVQSGGTAATYVGALQTSGSNTVTWDPKIYVDLQGEVAGTYEGQITHSVTGT